MDRQEMLQQFLSDPLMSDITGLDPEELRGVGYGNEQKSDRVLLEALKRLVSLCCEVSEERKADATIIREINLLIDRAAEEKG